ncbi:conserved hypothetical protein [uncultured Eubacteriales bacterium]|uniref:2Fe-2S ferredoxin-type domain-containing protein n=1 Tax=uncultured Eubacteriales bacterium TaxID=172733 RepID=A0A212J105_9FIRM|nr:conserved hypothetical protein [uncultured Eubacteriales bacterium]
MKIIVKKSTGERQYELPTDAGIATVMQALDYIYENLDHSLAYFRHSACCQGICGRCAVKVNGRTVLACTEKIDPQTERLLLEPAGQRIIRDLVTAPGGNKTTETPEEG